MISIRPQHREISEVSALYEESNIYVNKKVVEFAFTVHLLYGNNDL